MFQQILEIIPTVQLALSLVGMIIFVATYARWADWRATPAGRGIMYLMVSMSGILTMAFAHLVTGADYALANFFRIVVYGAFTASIGYLVTVLYKAQNLSWLSWLGLRKKNKNKRSKQ